jgi:8-oxo-dGTP pyrophosphatase MutT (NUDIX family)
MAVVRSAVRALIRQDDRLLVACYTDVAGEWFALPGGGQRYGEDLAQALIRECREEAGVSVRVGRLRFVRELITARLPSRNLPADLHQVEHIFECVAEGPSSGELALDRGQSGCRWVPLALLRNERFFPREVLDMLDEPSVVYLGVGSYQ